LAGAASPEADAAEVAVRVEGAARTLLERTVDATVHRVDGGDGSGSHVCAGPIGEKAGPTVTGALDDAARAAGLGWTGRWSSSSGDFLIDGIAGEAATPSGPWTILLNGVPTPVGGCSMKVAGGDSVLFARDVVFQTMTLGLSGPARVEPGEPFQLLVEDDRNAGVPVAGAEVDSGEMSATTDAGGLAGFAIAEPGRYTFKATHPDGIRSNSVRVCVGVGGCTAGAGPPVRISGLVDGSAFMRGAAPRRLRGTLRSGATPLVALKGRGFGGLCRHLASSGKGLAGRSCGAKLSWVPQAPGGLAWEQPVGRLPPGRYRILVRAEGTSGKPWRDGVNRIRFTVLDRRLASRRLVRRSVACLDRAARSRTVRESGLLSAWTGLALGARNRKSGRQLIRGLKSARPARVRTSELARDLASIRRILGGGTVAPMARELTTRLRDDGSLAGDVNLTAMAALALSGSYAETRALAWLAGRQLPDGGFGAGGVTSDVDTTGLAAWALSQAGFEGEVAAAASFVRSTQNPDGGFPAVDGAASNAQSTGMGLLAIHLAGGSRLGPRTPDGITPTHYLATLQRGDGSISYTRTLRTVPVWVTSQALLGLTRPELLGASHPGRR